MGADWIEDRFQQAGTSCTWTTACGRCGSREQVWLIDYTTPWKYLDGRRQAPGLHTLYLDSLSYEEREDFLSTVDHTGTGVWCQACIDHVTQKEPSIDQGIWSGQMNVTRYVRKI